MAVGFQISLAEAQAIFNHAISGDPAPGQNAHVFLMSLIAKRTNAIFLTILKAISDPKKPNSAAKRTIDNILKKMTNFLKIDFKTPTPSSGIGGWLENAYAEVGTSYTVFDDIAANGSGKESSYSLTVGGDVVEGTTVSFSLSKDLLAQRR